MISAAEVYALRKSSGAPVMDCKRALEHSDGDTQKAFDYLRQLGKAKAVKLANNKTKDGWIGTMHSADGKLICICAVSCETEAVANTDEFKEFVMKATMHEFYKHLDQGV